MGSRLLQLSAMSRTLKALLLLLLVGTVAVYAQAEDAADEADAAEGEDGDDGPRMEGEPGDGEGEDEEEDPAAILAEYDKDKDGKLSLQEIAEEDESDKPEDKESLEIIKSAFKQADADGDEKIDLKEMAVLIDILKN